MRKRALIAAAIGMVLLAGGGVAWRMRPVPDAGTAGTETLPIPPLPPRVAQGERYDRCLAMLTDDPRGAESLAQSWQTAGGGAAAAHCLALARIALGDPDGGASLLDAIAGGSAAPGAARAIVYDQAAQAWLMAGRAERALDASSAAVQLAPDNPDLRIDRALAAESLGHWAAAAADLGRALDADPRRPDALVLRGSALRQLGQVAAARADVDRALALDPEDVEALLERGILRQRGEDRSGARADWERAITLAPDSQAADLARQNLALLAAGPERR
jgi:tetratricopeptide (TPR) repeat protein